MPSVDPFAHPAPWQPDPFAFAQGPSAYAPSTAATGSSAARERALAAKEDGPRPRDALKIKVFSGKASREEVGLLVSACKAQHDTICVAALEPPKPLQ